VLTRHRAIPAHRSRRRRADVLVHEATFLEDEVFRARETRHSTARAAAELAAEAEVSLLALNYVSPRYGGPELREEARSAFEATIVPADLDRVEILFPESTTAQKMTAEAVTRLSGAVRD
jgi:ribonuclease Z